MLKASAAILAAALVTIAAPNVRAQSVLRADEDRVFLMVNSTRAAQGLAPLVRHEGLVDVARRQSVRMLAQRRLHHNADLRGELDALGLSWHWSGENVGVGPTADAIEKAFLASPDHYKNIVRPNYTALGIGVFGPTDTGYLYVTQVFAELAAAPSAPPALSSPQPPSAPPSPAPRPGPAPAADPPTPGEATPAGLLDRVVIEGGVTNNAPVPAPV